MKVNIQSHWQHFKGSLATRVATMLEGTETEHSHHHRNLVGPG